MGEIMNDINDAYASGLLKFPTHSDEEWEIIIAAEKLRDAKNLLLYKQKYEGKLCHYNKNDAYWHSCLVLEVKSYYEVIVRRISDNKEEIIPMYYFYDFEMLGD